MAKNKPNYWKAVLYQLLDKPLLAKILLFADYTDFQKYPGKKMIIEIRHYTIKPDRREEFIDFFEKKNREALRDAKMLVFGPMRDLEDPNKVHWLRAFRSLKDRDYLKDKFYSSPVWSKEVEPFVIPMIDDYRSELTETTEGFENFEGLSKTNV